MHRHVSTIRALIKGNSYLEMSVDPCAVGISGKMQRFDSTTNLLLLDKKHMGTPMVYMFYGSVLNCSYNIHACMQDLCSSLLVKNTYL